MDERLRACLRKHLPGNKERAINLIEDCLMNGADIDRISFIVPKELGLGSIETEIKFGDGIDKAVREFKTIKYREEEKQRTASAYELIFQLQDYLKVLNYDFGNAYFFNLGEGEYTQDEIDKLNNLLEACKETYSEVQLKNKIPDCDPDNCDKCILHNRKGCKKKTYIERFERWTG